MSSWTHGRDGTLFRCCWLMGKFPASAPSFAEHRLFWKLFLTLSYLLDSSTTRLWVRGLLLWWRKQPKDCPVGNHQCNTVNVCPSLKKHAAQWMTSKDRASREFTGFTGSSCILDNQMNYADFWASLNSFASNFCLRSWKSYRLSKSWIPLHPTFA